MAHGIEAGNRLNLLIPKMVSAVSEVKTDETLKTIVTMKNYAVELVLLHQNQAVSHF